jgi:flagellar motor switch protein FliN/FliY
MVDALGHMLDVKCRVDFIIGTGTLTVRDCLRLARHSVVRLDQFAGADLELRVHGVAVASGEVVIVDDSTTLRVSRITAPAGVEVAA